MIRLFPIDAATYIPSRLHADDRVWVETNCYVDLWIELLNGLGLECAPALAFTLSADFDGDQWQFLKFPPEDLRLLYGLDVAEINLWRGLEHHVGEQLAMGRFLLAEVDSWYLPDTARVSYRIEHVKTTIAPNMIDHEHRRLGYFHNAGYHELEGDDYAGIFGHGRDLPEVLPPYVERVRLDEIRPRSDRDLLDVALPLVWTHIARRPATNPVQRFATRLRKDAEWLAGESLAIFHQYAFATLRQCGSAAELTGSLCEWLGACGQPTGEAAREWYAVATAAKAAQFQLARLANGRAIDVDAMLAPLERQWDVAMRTVVEQYG